METRDCGVAGAQSNRLMALNTRLNGMAHATDSHTVFSHIAQRHHLSVGECSFFRWVRSRLLRVSRLADTRIRPIV